MRLISLNVWGGKAFAPLMNFIEKSAKSTDVFCFQEVLHFSELKEGEGGRTKILDDITAKLSDFIWYFTPAQDHYDLTGKVNFNVVTGKAMCVREGIEVESEGSIAIYHGDVDKFDRANIPTNLQYIRLISGGKRFTICNFHGMAFPGNKLDTPERIGQSRKLKDFLDREEGAKILCGDFNLLPNDKSVAILEENMTDLIKKFNIRETRGRLSPYFGKPDAQHFADYMFVSPDVRVLDFKVPDVGVSDHLPMILEFE